MVVAMALILALRERLAAREGPRWEGRFPRDAGPSRWVRLVSSAVHELTSHLASIGALARLVAAQTDATPRARADAARLHERTEAATRVVRNLLAALPSAGVLRERLAVNRVVEDAVDGRRAALLKDGITVSCLFSPGVPDLPLDPAALRHAIVALLDRAALALRTSGTADGRIEVATALRAGAVHVTIGDSAAVPPGAVMARLMDALLDSPEPRVDSELKRSLVRESVERQGGSLAVGHRPGGGTEFVIRLPVAATALPAAEEAAMRRGAS
jgi:signal transduction histidine kinase